MEDKNKPIVTVSVFKKPKIRQFIDEKFSNLSPKEKTRKIKLVLFLVVIVIIVGGLVWQQQRENSRIAALNFVVEGLTPVQRAQFFSDKGEYKLAEKVWNEELLKTKDTPTKLSIYFMQSSIAEKFKKYNDAKKYADQALKLAPNSSTTYVTLANLSQSQGDKAAAKKYWQLAIKYIDPKNPAANLIQRDYQTNLDALK